MGKPYKLLIIDDNKEILTAICAFFTNKKYVVVCASDGLEGLKFLESEKKGFDLVITDIVMPNISGIGLIAMIKKKHSNTPVIAITGWGEHPEALASEAKADRVLEKPFELVQLAKLVDELLG